MVSLNAEIFKDGIIQIDILDLEVLIIRRMKIKAQQKIRKTGIFVSKDLFRCKVLLLKNSVKLYPIMLRMSVIIF